TQHRGSPAAPPPPARIGSARRMRSSRFSPASLACLLALGCTRQGAPCAAPTCGAGYECLANRCVVVGSDPVPGTTERVVLEPAAFASTEATEGTAVATVTL